MHAIHRFVAALALLSCTPQAPCQGVFVPDAPQPAVHRPAPHRPPLRQPAAVESGLLRVETVIEDGAATTVLRQTLHNRTGRPQEAWWFLPLPDGATADRFAMTVDGQQLQGEVLAAEQARRVYEQIVRRQRDPGLLEYLGSGMLRARVFPVPAQGELEVEVRYTQLLRPAGGVTTWRFPLRAAWACGAGPSHLGLKVELRSTTGLKAIWSPLAELEVVRDGEHRARASLELERAQLPDRDLTLYFGADDSDFGANVLTFRRPGEDGYFLALLAPKRQWPEQRELGRAINLVLDTSGSMQGEKIRQARAAVRAFVGSLTDDDWFNVIPFATDARPFFPAPVRATAEHRQAALQRVDGLQARGGTNIEDALRRALADALPDCYKTADGPRRLVPITVFVTDGLPTVGLTDVDALLTHARAGNAEKARLFAFGVGDDVNTRLLDTLAAETRGDRDYVRPGEDIEVATSALFEKLSGPVMTDVALDIDGVEVDRVEPRALPDLFVTGQLAVFGRYRGAGNHALRLCGSVGGDRHEYVFEADFPRQAAGHDWLPALWAQRRIAALLDAIRLNGSQPELIAEVERLGREHGIVTPYTSHLVVEDGQRVAAARGVRTGVRLDSEADAERVRRDLDRAGAAPPAAEELADLGRRAQAEARQSAAGLASTAEVGAAAVEKSAALRRLAEARSYRATDGAAALLTRRVGARVFHLVGGVWVDQAYRSELADRTVRVRAFSDDYFALLQRRPELARTLAFSTEMVVVLGDQVIEIVAE